MAGHSKWANIRHKKERTDAKKGKLFSRLAKEIITAVKLGGEDPKSNSRLRLVLNKCKEANMPSDNIARNIKKASSGDVGNYETIMYELYGHNGVGILVEMLTDNKNRAASDMRIATNKRGGSLATPGSVSFNFERKGILQVNIEANEEELFSKAIEAGAEDFEKTEDAYMITTAPEMVFEIKEAIESSGKVDLAEIDYLAKNVVDCDQEAREKNLALLAFLEDLDDAQGVWHNMA